MSLASWADEGPRRLTSLRTATSAGSADRGPETWLTSGRASRRVLSGRCKAFRPLRGRVTFSCWPKRKSPKRRAFPDGSNRPSRSRRDFSTGHPCPVEERPPGLQATFRLDVDQKLELRRPGNFQQTSVWSSRDVVPLHFTPMQRRRWVPACAGMTAPSSSGELLRDLPDPWGAAHGCAAFSDRARMASRRIPTHSPPNRQLRRGKALSFGYFSLGKQRKVTRRKAEALLLPRQRETKAMSMGPRLRGDDASQLRRSVSRASRASRRHCPEQYAETCALPTTEHTTP
jgi:hypothetical protein